MARAAFGGLPGVRIEVIGGRGKERVEKLSHHLRRVKALAELVEGWGLPDASVAKASPEAARVSFGLGVKHVTLNDNDLSEHVSRLTFSLSDRVIVPEEFGRGRAVALGARADAVVTFRGIFERSHVVDYLESGSFLESEVPGLEKFESYLIVRPGDPYASYSTGTPPLAQMISKVLREGEGVLLIPRRSEDVAEFRAWLRGDVVTPPGPVDVMELSRGAVAVVSGGGTIAREAALLGVPAITMFGRELAPNRVLKKRGLLMEATDLSGLREALELARSEKFREFIREESRRFLEESEDAAEVLVRVLSSLV